MDFQINLMHVLIIGPLLFYIGSKKKENTNNIYYMILTLILLLPFMVRFPSLNFKSSRDYNRTIHLILFTSVEYYIFKKKNDLPNYVFDILKYSGLAVITIHLYLSFEKYKRFY